MIHVNNLRGERDALERKVIEIIVGIEWSKLSELEQLEFRGTRERFLYEKSKALTLRYICNPGDMNAINELKAMTRSAQGDDIGSLDRFDSLCRQVWFAEQEAVTCG